MSFAFPTAVASHVLFGVENFTIKQNKLRPQLLLVMTDSTRNFTNIQTKSNKGNYIIFKVS